MKAIILAAGEGSRLGKLSEGRPKCLIDIEDNTLLEIQINTLHVCGIEDISVVRGYEGDKINTPGLKYYDSPDYSTTNMLHSLFCARKEMTGDVLVLYSDILYEEQVVKRLLESNHDIAVGVMVNWEEAIEHRSTVALEELEMVYFDSENRIQQIGKKKTSQYETNGQFIGMVKYSHRGIEILKRNYDRAKQYYSGKPFGQADVFAKAWQTDLFQEMTELGVPLHCVIIERGWMEIDTPEDYERALKDTKFVRRMVKKKTNWDNRAKFYNGLDWVNKDELLNAIVEMSGDLTGKKVLDVGTGTGKVLIALKMQCGEADFYGIDISQGMLDKIDSSYGFKLSIRAIEDLKTFKNNYFDLVTARMVFHHANDIEKAMAGVYHVLKKGGTFILCEGNPPDCNCIQFYKDMFRFKEDRITFLSDDMVNLFIRHNFQGIISKTIVLKEMSLNNWLENSGLPFRNTDIIKKMHCECDSSVQRAYNMKFKNNDIFMDWKFSVVCGIK
ncbi:MAG: methyltransferase domain-containing protein [Phycisphaerae bacterium]